MRWLVIVNPLAGGGAAGKHWIGVSSMLDDMGIRYSARFTDSPETTRALTAEAVDSGFEGLAVYGGDGTVSDAASVLSGNLGVALAILPAGSGNDWARSLGYPSPSPLSSARAMKRGSFKVTDTGSAEWNGSSRFFLNSAGMGFDAFVLQRAVSLRRVLPLNRACYIASLLISALIPPVWEGELSCDGKTFHTGEYLTFTAGVGAYSGGGMMLAPSAVPWDRELDGLCLSSLGFFSILGNLRRIFSGTLAETKWSSAARGERMTVRRTGGRPLLLELDGEPVDIGDSDLVEIVSVPGSLRAAVPPS